LAASKLKHDSAFLREKFPGMKPLVGGGFSLFGAIAPEVPVSDRDLPRTSNSVVPPPFVPCLASSSPASTLLPLSKGSIVPTKPPPPPFVPPVPLFLQCPEKRDPVPSKIPKPSGLKIVTGFAKAAQLPQVNPAPVTPPSSPIRAPAPDPSPSSSAPGPPSPIGAEVDSPFCQVGSPFWVAFLPREASDFSCEVKESKKDVKPRAKPVLTHISLLRKPTPRAVRVAFPPIRLDPFGEEMFPCTCSKPEECVDLRACPTSKFALMSDDIPVWQTWGQLVERETYFNQDYMYMPHFANVGNVKAKVRMLNKHIASRPPVITQTWWQRSIVPVFHITRVPLPPTNTAIGAAAAVAGVESVLVYYAADFRKFRGVHSIGEWVKNHMPFLQSSVTYEINSTEGLTQEETLFVKSNAKSSHTWGLPWSDHWNKLPSYIGKEFKDQLFLTAANFSSYATVSIYTELYRSMMNLGDDNTRMVHAREIVRFNKETGKFEVVSSFMSAARNVIYKAPNANQFFNANPQVFYNTLHHFVQQKMMHAVREAMTHTETLVPAFRSWGRR
jgi:hypothetical protein